MARAAVLLAALAAPAPLAAQTLAPPPPTLTAFGTGSASAAPDRATISFRIESVDDRAATASAQNNAVAAALESAVVRLGLPAAAVTTRAYALTYNPRPPKPDPNQPARFGYIVERNVEVKVERVESVGSVVDAGIGAGVTSVNGVTFGLRDPQATYRSALAAAVADARAEAQTLAAAGHVRLVKLLSIAPSGRVGPPIGARAAVAAPLGAPLPTVIDPGDLTASATVTLRYQIAPQ